MGFIRAFTGALSGTLSDQWLDFYMPKDGFSPTVAILPAVKKSINNNRGVNVKGNKDLISNGSRFIVPEGMALITLQNGAISGYITQAGGYEFTTDDVNAKSVFAGDGIIDTILKASIDKFKFGGIPATQIIAFYVNMREIPNNKFGTQSTIYWDDAFFGTQVGAVTRGTYTLKIVDPILFIKNFVPAEYLLPNAPVFDFADLDNDAGTQLFNEVVSSLSGAFSNYVNDASMGNRITKIQADQAGFASSLSKVVEEQYQWHSSRGIEIVKTAILSIEYDKDTLELMKDVKRADALSGNRGNSFMQQAVARGIEAAGSNGGGSNIAFMGMGATAATNIMNSMQQQNYANSYQPNFAHTQNSNNKVENNTQEASTGLSSDPTEKLIQMKKLLDAGVISKEEFEEAKKQILGF